MAQVSVVVNGRSYVVGCGDGEEEHVQDLARFVDHRVKELVDSANGKVGESQLLLMAALLIADDLATAYEKADRLQGELEAVRGSPADLRVSEGALNQLAERVERVAASLQSA